MVPDSEVSCTRGYWYLSWDRHSRHTDLNRRFANHYHILVEIFFSFPFLPVDDLGFTGRCSVPEYKGSVFWCVHVLNVALMHSLVPTCHKRSWRNSTHHSKNTKLNAPPCCLQLYWKDVISFQLTRRGESSNQARWPCLAGRNPNIGKWYTIVYLYCDTELAATPCLFGRWRSSIF